MLDVVAFAAVKYNVAPSANEGWCQHNVYISICNVGREDKYRDIICTCQVRPYGFENGGSSRQSSRISATISEKCEYYNPTKTGMCVKKEM